MSLTAQQFADALRAAANSLDPGKSGAAIPQGGLLTSPPPPVSTALDVTGDQLTALIQPHIGNETIKAALGEAMRSRGVANLPEAQPHQFGMLYQAFQEVLARHGIGGPVSPPATGGSII